MFNSKLWNKHNKRNRKSRLQVWQQETIHILASLLIITFMHMSKNVKLTRVEFSIFPSTVTRSQRQALTYLHHITKKNNAQNVNKASWEQFFTLYTITSKMCATIRPCSTFLTKECNYCPFHTSKLRQESNISAALLIILRTIPGPSSTSLNTKKEANTAVSTFIHSSF